MRFGYTDIMEKFKLTGSDVGNSSHISDTHYQQT